MNDKTHAGMQDQGTYGREGELAHEQMCVRALAYAHVQGSENETKRGLRKKLKQDTQSKSGEQSRKTPQETIATPQATRMRKQTQ